MITADGPKLIEYNVRFGDPECQVLMLRLKDDLLVLLNAAADGQLADMSARWRDEAALTRRHGGEGLSGHAGKRHADRRHRGGESKPAREVFHAGTALRGRQARRQRRPRAQRHRDRQDGRRGAERSLRGGRRNRLAGRLLPPRHRLARGRAGEAWGVGVRHRKNW